MVNMPARLKVSSSATRKMPVTTMRCQPARTTRPTAIDTTSAMPSALGSTDAAESHGPFGTAFGEREARRGVFRRVTEDPQIPERGLVGVECHDVQAEDRIGQRRVDEYAAELLQMLPRQTAQCDRDQGDHRPPDDLDDVAHAHAGYRDRRDRRDHERDDRPFQRMNRTGQSRMHKQRDHRTECERQI